MYNASDWAAEVEELERQLEQSPNKICRELTDWLLSEPRPRAQDSFKLGPARQLACHIEDTIQQAREEGKASGKNVGLYPTTRSYI